MSFPARPFWHAAARVLRWQAIKAARSRMMTSWWWLWMAVMFFLLVPPIGYGWGYRGWGPPYPSYIQRRRGLQAVSGAGFDHHAWGRGGDVLWVVLLIGVFWAITGFWWR